MQLYPIWNSNSHGPAMSALEISELDQAPADLVAFIDEENLVARLRLLGWAVVADDVENGIGANNR